MQELLAITKVKEIESEGEGFSSQLMDSQTKHSLGMDHVPVLEMILTMTQWGSEMAQWEKPLLPRLMT